MSFTGTSADLLYTVGILLSTSEDDGLWVDSCTEKLAQQNKAAEILREAIKQQLLLIFFEN